MTRYGAFNRTHSAVALLAIQSLLSSAAVQASCAKATLTQADSCNALVVQADLSQCNDELAKAPVVRCTKGSREIRLIGKDGAYVAVLGKKEGAWGAPTWELGDFRKEPTRSPAGNRPMPATGTEPKPAEPVAKPAQAEPPPPVASPAPPVIQFSGYFDAYVAHNFNRPSARTPGVGSTLAGPQTQLRYYDWTSDQLTLNLAEVTIKHQGKEVSALIDLDFGQQADLNAQAATLSSSGGPTPGLVDEVSKHLGQAHVSYSPSSVSGLVLDVGKMYTHVGLEVAKARDNWNYSRSSIFGYGGPFWHVGIHAGYAVVPDKLSASLYLYNGWNSIYANGSNPTYGAQLRWTPNSRTSVTYNYIGGPEQAGNNSNWRQVHEVNATLACTEDVTAAVDTLIGMEKGVTTTSGTMLDARWGGAQIGVKWQLTQRASIAPRLEYYRDADGYTLGGDAQSLTSATLTPSFLLTDGLEARIEFRYDRSSQADRFAKTDGTSSTQSTVLFGVLYSF